MKTYVVFKIALNLVVILIISSCMTSKQILNYETLKNRIYIIEGNYHFFQFVSEDSVRRISYNDYTIFDEEKYKYHVRQDTIEIIPDSLSYSLTGSYLLKYFPTEDYFMEINDLDVYWRKSCVTYSENDKWCE